MSDQGSMVLVLMELLDLWCNYKFREGKSVKPFFLVSDVRFVYVPCNLGICAILRLCCAFSESRDCVPSASSAGSFCRSWMIFCHFSLDMVLLVWQPFSPYRSVQNFSKTFRCSLMDSITQLFQVAICMEADAAYQLRISSILRATHSKSLTVRQTGKV